jgi:hypothetical protein
MFHVEHRIVGETQGERGTQLFHVEQLRTQLPRKGSEPFLIDYRYQFETPWNWAEFKAQNREFSTAVGFLPLDFAKFETSRKILAVQSFARNPDGGIQDGFHKLSAIPTTQMTAR